LFALSCCSVRSFSLRLTSLMLPRPPGPPLFPYTTLFRSRFAGQLDALALVHRVTGLRQHFAAGERFDVVVDRIDVIYLGGEQARSEEHTSELQSRENLVCRLLLEKKKKEEPIL